MTDFLWIDDLIHVIKYFAYVKLNHNTRNPRTWEPRTPSSRILKKFLNCKPNFLSKKPFWNDALFLHKRVEKVRSIIEYCDSVEEASSHDATFGRRAFRCHATNECLAPPSEWASCPAGFPAGVDGDFIHHSRFWRLCRHLRHHLCTAHRNWHVENDGVCCATNWSECWFWIP